MANRQCLKSISRHSPPLISSNPLYQNLKTPLPALSNIIRPLHQLHNNNPNPASYLHQFLQHPTSNQLTSLRNFSSFQRRIIRPGDKHEQGVEEEEDYDEDDVDEEDDDDSEEEEDEMSDEEQVGGMPVATKRTYTVEEKKHEAAGIGYNVIGPLDPTERPFKHREPYFAVVQIGSHQFKVSNGDVIYTEKLKFCEVNDKLILTKVLMVGSKSQTIIGRPILPEAAVHAVVEEHALDAKVIIFKKKRRKNYRRTKGHRQELTRLRITDIQGIEKPEKVEKVKPEKVEKVKAEEAAVAA